jgi:GNAT superfamily N-acetyltransferase
VFYSEREDERNFQSRLTGLGGAVTGEMTKMMASGGVVMRKLEPSDIPSALEMSAEAGWNQTAEDWCTLLDLSLVGCLGIEVNGELASTTTLLCYGQRLAWIGMVLTRIRYRGQGFARRLLTQALQLADEMRIETVKLDATDQGQPLYEKLGFRCEQSVERWWRPGAGGFVHECAADHQTSDGDWRALDLRAFGADRSELLAHLRRKSLPLTLESSFLFRRPGRVSSYLGPCVAGAPETARTLMERALETPVEGGWSWDLLCENPQAVALAHTLGFTPKRHLTRMVRGRDQRGNEQDTYAIAGFELG